MSTLIDFYERLLFDDKSAASDNEIVDIIRITKLFNLFIVNNIKDLFDRITQDSCSVTIKMINGYNESDAIISTLIRNTRSYTRRRLNDQHMSRPFLWHENTAFKQILLKDNLYSHYASDNLSNEKEYVNLNKNWKNHYNATLVSAIRLGERPDDINDESSNFESIMGFICIDNMNGGLNNQTCIDLLSLIADSLYLYFLQTDKIIELATSRNKEIENPNKT